MQIVKTLIFVIMIYDTTFKPVKVKMDASDEMANYTPFRSARQKATTNDQFVCQILISRH